MTWFEIISIIGSIIAFLGGMLGIVVWFMVTRALSSMDALEDSIGMIQTNLMDYKLFAANTFAKDADLKGSLRDIQASMNIMQTALNANTNMTAAMSANVSVLMERTKN